MQDLGNLKKLSAQPEWRKKTCKHLIDGGKNFLPPRNHNTPQGKIMSVPTCNDVDFDYSVEIRINL